MSIQTNKKKLTSKNSLQKEIAVGSKISIFNKPFNQKVYLSLFFSMLVVLAPVQAEASFFSSIGDFFGIGVQAENSVKGEIVHNSQNIALMESNLTPEMKNGQNELDITIVGEQALESNNGPLGTQADYSNFIPADTKINVYIVQNGDTIDSIAKKNKVSKAAIIYANDNIARKDLVKAGQALVIAPLNGVMYTVKKGETAKIISDRYGISVGNILEYNVLSKASDLKAGDSIILVGLDSKAIAKADKAEKEKSVVKVVPKKEIVKVEVPEVKEQPQIQEEQKPSTQISSDAPSGKEYIWPFPGGAGSISQGPHDGNGVDIRAPKGTPIYAVKAGTVLIADGVGWNGGYGEYVVINFNDGSQGLFGHMSKVIAKPGQVVAQGDLIGLVGSTGSSTGNHLHMEIRGGYKNPLAPLRVGATSADFYNLYK